MKTEDFDDAIRGKLEGINQKFDEEDIDRVYNYVSHNMHVPFWKAYGATILYASGAAAMIILMVWNGFQFHENRELRQQVTSLQSQINTTIQNKSIIKPASIQYEKATNRISSQKNEYREEKSVKILDHAVKNNNVYAAETNITAENETTEAKQKNTDLVLKNNKDNQSQEEVISESNRAISAETGTTLMQKTDTSLNEQSTIVIESNSVVAPIKYTDTIKAANTQSVDNKPVIAESSEKKSLDSSVVAVNPEKPKQNTSFSFGALFKNIGNSISTTTNETQNNHISIKNLRFRGGIEVEKANLQMGAGLLGEMLFSKRWGLSSGIKVLNVNNEKYADEDDFYHKKGMPFQHAYSKDVPDTTAKNIGMHNILVQVPIAITYQLPLKYNYSIIASAGTDLDIYAKQLIDYNRMGFPQPQTFTTNTPVVAFNNVVVSIGLQKRWKKFVFQASPFVSPQFKSVVYKKEDLYAGVKFSVLFSNEKRN
jgi:hypothetical protein